ncbi:beta-N-acetylhexosaminidase [Salegentibacter maritimus]|uniref:beta-N-acetylhexosaminidase n=1 Tax=Salegentibacter maritimus TaxID=2794347 RepID=A0ABS0TIA8_9FLAO|nr:beta-N-acetylhexosaminidase [Salegentibacter maritimus]MBI6120799.1 beta-N-acetylhexosaminidase [Salegentibacter maritimus]
MRKIITSLFLTMSIISCDTSKSYEEFAKVENKKQDYAIIPLPQKMETSKGVFIVDEHTKIQVSQDLSQEGQFLSDYIEEVTGIAPEIKLNEKEVERSISLKISTDFDRDEAYNLIVTHEKVVVEGASAKGVFYGVQTLKQLLPLQSEIDAESAEIAIPAVTISDAPAFDYRGMHLDVARHMFPVEFIKKYIDLIAMHKMNTFHWHLTEDQGWRIEIKQYPKLTEIGSIRKETMIEKNFDPYKGDGEEYGGYYTQEEVKDIVAYAAKRHVTVIPEIELPGHSRAVLAAYPELGNGTGPYEVATKWGVFKEILAPKEETFEFLENVLTEVMELFPSEYIHIGGDEAPKTEWEQSAQAQEVIKREGLKDEHELQSYFIRRIEKFLNENGRQIIGWDEILEGGLAPNATVMSWRGNQGGIEAAKQKHNVVMTPNTHLYFDHYQSDPETEPLAIGGNSTVSHVYSFDPVPEELSAGEEKYILGAQANVWTEYMKDSDYVEYMVLPRMTALSEVVWTYPEERNWDEFKARLVEFKKLYDQMDLNYATHVFDEVNNEENTLADE